MDRTAETLESRQWRRRIRRAYADASAADRADGMAWYATANAAADAIGARYGLPRHAAAGIIAALSPRQQWAANVRAAERVAAAAANGDAAPPKVGLGSNVAKAWRIANGEDPDSVLGGPKVRAFYANITGDLRAVTVDVWAARAAYGRADAPVPAGRRYARLADAYRAVADSLGVAPRDLQAAVWVHVRGAAQ